MLGMTRAEVMKACCVLSFGDTNSGGGAAKGVLICISEGS